MHYKSLLSLLLLFATSASLNSMDHQPGGEAERTPMAQQSEPIAPPRQTIKECITEMQQTLQLVDQEEQGLLPTIQRWSKGVSIPVAVTTAVATFKAIKHALPDKDDIILPGVIAAGICWASYKLTKPAAAWLLSRETAKRTISSDYKEHMQYYNQALKGQQDEICKLHLTTEALHVQAVANVDPRIKKRLLHCAMYPLHDE